MAEARCHIGTSGWSYKHWSGVFYPEDLKPKGWLSFYRKSFSTVELNNSFYNLPSEKAVQNWRETVGEGFIFSVKASRYITHIKRLLSSEEPLGRFLGRMEMMGESLGPILFQLPPNLKCNLKRLSEFLELLPVGKLYVFEFRNETWFNQEVLGLLDRRGVAFCIHDMNGMNCPIETTGPFVYIRFHGSGVKYGGRYPLEHLKDWAKRIGFFLKKGIDVYAYFNNDICGYAVMNAIELKEMSG